MHHKKQRDACGETPPIKSGIVITGRAARKLKARKQ
jgi:hypothetical protein